MRSLVIVGTVSIVGALFVACSDEEGGGGIAGSAGTSGSAGAAGTGGTGGTAGTSGTGGTGGSAGTSGTGGSAGAAGTGGSGVVESDAGADAGLGPCTGCLEVRVSVTDENQLAPFNIDLGGSNLVDFSAGSITFHIRADAFGDSVGVVPFVNDGTNFSFQGGAFTSLNGTNGFGTADFVSVTQDLAGIALPPDGPDAGPPDPDTFDKREIRVIGIQIGTGGGFVGSAADAGADAGADDIVVFIDSITFTGIGGEIADFEFSADAQGFVLNTNFGHQDAVIIHH